MEKNIENIIRNKSYLELDQNERDLLKDWANNEEEFNQLKMVFLSTDAFSQRQEEELNPTIKQRLDVRFKEKFEKQRLVWYNKLWMFLWPSDTGVVRKPLVQLAAVGIVVALVTPFLFQNGELDKRVAVNDNTPQEEIAPSKEGEKSDKSKEIEESKEADIPEEVALKDNVSEVSEPARETRNKQEGIQKNTEINDEKENFGADKGIDNLDTSKGWRLTDEIADSEKPEMEDQLVQQDRMNKNQKKDAAGESQAVFAGAVSSDFDDERQPNDTRDQSYEAKPKKVDTKKTLDFISALY